MTILPRHLLWTTLLALTCVTPVAKGQPNNSPRDRREFAKAFWQLREGMPKNRILALLGRPDDVRTKRDPGHLSPVGTKEIWRYGTSGHLTTATLGQVYLDANDCVLDVFGKGSPPPEGMFDEQSLRVLLEALSEVPSYNSGWTTYNPRNVIRAVNLLQPLGKEKALAVIDEFLRVSSHWHDVGRDGVFLVLRTLFDVPDDPGYMPTMYVGKPHPTGPADKKLVPRFPIALQGDIPFLLVEGYWSFGSSEGPKPHVDYFRRHGRLRAKPLAPSPQPFKELAELAKSHWVRAEEESFYNDERRSQLLAEQLLRLMDTVYPVEPGPIGNLLPFDRQGADRRNRILKEAAGLKIEWDADAQKYILAANSAE